MATVADRGRKSRGSSDDRSTCPSFRGNRIIFEMTTMEKVPFTLVMRVERGFWNVYVKRHGVGRWILVAQVSEGDADRNQERLTHYLTTAFKQALKTHFGEVEMRIRVHGVVQEGHA